MLCSGRDEEAMDGLSLSAAVLFIGHSLVNHTLPWMLEFVVASQGGGRHVEEQIINGAPLAWSWDHSAEAEGGVDARAILPRGGVDVVVMTEAVPLVNHTTWSESNRYALAFYRLATDANPEPGSTSTRPGTASTAAPGSTCLTTTRTPCRGGNGSTRIAPAGSASPITSTPTATPARRRC